MIEVAKEIQDNIKAEDKKEKETTQEPRLIKRALIRIKIERELTRGGLTSWVKC